MGELSKRISSTLKIANLISIILVVAIHYNSKHYMDLSSGLTLNYYFQEWFTNSISRVAVPFFAFTAGFFYFFSFERLSDYRLQLIKRCWSLIIPYMIAVSIVLLHDVTLKILMGREISGTLGELGYYFLHPNSVQFWFLRDLIIIVIVFCPLIHLSIDRFPRLVLGILFFLWFLEIQPFPRLAGWYLVNIEVLFFFAVGCFFAKNKNTFENALISIENNRLLILLSFLIMSFLRVIFAPTFWVWYGVGGGNIGSLFLYKLTILIGLPALYLVSLPLRKNKVLTWLSTFSFFIFLYHIKPVSTISINMSSFLVPDSLLFYLTFPLGVGISIFFAWIFKKTFPRVYTYITGGR